MPTIILQILLLIPWVSIIELIIKLIQDRQKEIHNPGITKEQAREKNIQILLKEHPDMPECRLRFMHELVYDVLRYCKSIAKDWKQVLDEYLSQWGFDHKVIYEPTYDPMKMYYEMGKKTYGK